MSEKKTAAQLESAADALLSEDTAAVKKAAPVLARIVPRRPAPC